MFGLGGQRIVLQASAVAPGAQGWAHLGRDRNGNLVVDLRVEHLARPESLTPPRQAYVVWVRRPDEIAENKGELRVGKNLEGRIQFLTAVSEFTLVVTAEDNPTVASPGPTELLHGRPGQRAA